MKILLAIAFLCVAANVSAQRSSGNEYRNRIGLKAGYNISWVTGTQGDFNPDNRSGFMVGGFLSPKSRGGFGFRTELVFSRQGFSYDAGGEKEQVTQDYIYLPQLTTFGIGRFVQLQAGAQIGFLLNAKTSQEEQSTGEKVIDYFNRIDYGFAGGLEVYPFKGLLVGARYNISFGNIYKQMEAGVPSPIPNPNELKGKNSVVQIFAGYRF